MLIPPYAHLTPFAPILKCTLERHNFLPTAQGIQEKLAKIAGTGRTWRELGDTVLGQGSGHELVYIGLTIAQVTQSVGHTRLAHDRD
jgi:hypothetical protein